MKINLLILLSCLLFSCSKEELSAVKNNSIEKKEFKFDAFSATTAKGAIKISLSVSNDSDLKYYQLYAGKDGKQLCVINEFKPFSDSSATHSYTIYDNDPKGNTSYYMIGYVDANGQLRFYDKMLKVQIDN